MTKKKQGGDTAAQDVLYATLCLHGEAFMSQFDTYKTRATKSKRSVATHQRQAPCEDPSRQTKAKLHTATPVLASSPSSTQALTELREPDEIKQLFDRGAKKPKVEAVVPALARMAPVVNVKAAKRLFMSSRADRIHEPTHAIQPAERLPVQSEELGGELTPDDFKRLQFDVQKLGAVALDKKGKKVWQAQLMQQLGARQQKGPRVPASIGFGIARKGAERAARAREEAIAAGMLRIKGTGKKKRRDKSRQRDRGLQEAGSSFRGGVLRISKDDKPKAERKQRSAKLPF